MTSVALKSRAGRKHDQLRYHREIETTTPGTRDVGARSGRGCGSDALVFDILKDVVGLVYHKKKTNVTSNDSSMANCRKSQRFDTQL